ncbi:hypothetical protein DV515_00015089 [Chloebia gouldiae]|uniref:Uncharacterized protein n=1 Tax=Chloebia gouldiae TaxID=44316 RepID=A0A3L8RWP8_CHLGU|nr:hypothetical protein DV515_00015089 [Chloebia gouldiae]
MALGQEIIEETRIFQNLDCSPTRTPWHYSFECDVLSQGALVISPWKAPQAQRILHIYAAKGLRAHTLAAAERMKALRRLDAKEHRGKAAIVHDLIQAGADVNAVDNKGQSALHLAAAYGYTQVLQKKVILALGFPLDLEMKDFEGHTPLHCAVLAHNTLLRDQGSQALTEEQHRELQQQGRELQSCIHLLVHTGASIYSRDVKSNKTVLHYTVQDGNVSLLRYFLELNAFKSKDFVNNKLFSHLQPLPVIPDQTGHRFLHGLVAPELLQHPPSMAGFTASSVLPLQILSLEPIHA